MTVHRARHATPDDADAITRIYNEGIADRVGTFETRERTPDDVRQWFDGRHPIVVVEQAGWLDCRVRLDLVLSSARVLCRHRRVLGLCRAARRGRGRWARGDGRRSSTRRGTAGFWKLVSRVFVENSASRELLASVGFREVGVYEKHAHLDGVWRDVVIVERLIPENQPGMTPSCSGHGFPAPRCCSASRCSG